MSTVIPRKITVLTHGNISAPLEWGVGNLIWDTEDVAYFKIVGIAETLKNNSRYVELTLDDGTVIKLSDSQAYSWTQRVLAFTERYLSVVHREWPTL